MADYYKQLVAQAPWLETLFTIVFILLATAILSRIVSQFFKKILTRDNAPVASGSIFVNIARATIWCVGVSVILETCFDVNVSAFVAALGVGGIAISLGFQDTLSNLIGGLQLLLAGIIKKGDYIEVLGKQGKVVDTTWRHTSIIDVKGNIDLIPNSLINKNSLRHLTDVLEVKVPVLVPPNADLALFSAELCDASSKVAGAALFPGAQPNVFFTGTVLGGVTATVVVPVIRGEVNADIITDKVARCVAGLIAS